MKRLFLSVPKVQMFLALNVVFWSTILYSYSVQAIVSYFTLVIVALFIEFIFLEVREIQLFPLWAGLISAVIIALLSTPDNLFLGIVCVIIAIASKQFLRMKERHLFNPAAFGLLIGHAIFHAHISWWAVSFQQPSMSIAVLPFLALFMPSLVSGIRLRRQRIFLAFLVVYFVFVFVLHTLLGSTSIMQVLFGNPTIFFFAFVMLPEPMTSPNKAGIQMIYGSFVALLFSLLTLPFLNTYLQLVPDILLLSLLIGNVLFSDLVLSFFNRSPQPAPSLTGE